jgi:hypothetical protein
MLTEVGRFNLALPEESCRKVTAASPPDLR